MATATFPALCEVVIICDGTHTVSQVLPAGVPIVKFIDNIHDSINMELAERAIDQLPAADYRLNRIDGVRLDSSRTLQELGVTNGQALVLTPAEEGDSYEPQYEQLSTGLARVGKQLIGQVSAAVATNVALVILTAIAVVIAALSVRARTFTDGLAAASTTAAVGATLVLMAVLTVRWWPRQHRIIDALVWQGSALATVAAYMVAPGRLGAPQLMLAGVVAVVAAAGIARWTGRHVSAAAAVITLAAIGAVSVAARMWSAVPAQWLGLITLLTLLVALFYAERVALRVCRVRPPYFGSVTGDDIFATDKGMPLDTVAPVDDTGRDPSPTGVQLADTALRVHAVLSGICWGLAAMLPVAVWATLAPGHDKAWAAALVCVLFVVIYISRGRAFMAWRQAVALVMGAVGAVLAGTVKYALHYDAANTAQFAAAVAALLVFALCGLAAAVIVPQARYHPPVRLFVEWLEITAIVFTVPLMAWLSGLLAWIRLR
jgi:type VII secretion integral membrane protein EccD